MANRGTCEICGQPNLELETVLGEAAQPAPGQKLILPGGVRVVACRGCVLEVTRQAQSIVAGDVLGDGRTRTQTIATFLATTTLPQGGR